MPVASLHSASAMQEPLPEAATASAYEAPGSERPAQVPTVLGAHQEYPLLTEAASRQVRAIDGNAAPQHARDRQLLERTYISRYLSSLLSRLEGSGAAQTPTQAPTAANPEEEDEMDARRKSVRMMFR